MLLLRHEESDVLLGVVEPLEQGGGVLTARFAEVIQGEVLFVPVPFQKSNISHLTEGFFDQLPRIIIILDLYGQQFSIHVQEIDPKLLVVLKCDLFFAGQIEHLKTDVVLFSLSAVVKHI